ncbi:MAG: hypothetical protein ACR2RA_19115 [Geminicoccaceae bacterium]
MNKEEMQSRMHEMMQKMCSNMTSDEKTEMMMGMMGKMKESMNIEDMMRKMSTKEGLGGMKEMMAKMTQGGEGRETMMPEMMLKDMMPHCIKMMMPTISKDKRADLVSGMISTLMEQASNDMSDEEKASFAARVAESISADSR